MTNDADKIEAALRAERDAWLADRRRTERQTLADAFKTPNTKGKQP